MRLTREQARIIRRWGETTQYVSKVRLFGSYATGRATAQSDIDLAVTIGSDVDPGTVRGIYFAKGRQWQMKLTRLLARKVHVSLYNDPDTRIVRDSCDKCSVILFPSNAPVPSTMDR